MTNTAQAFTLMSAIAPWVIVAILLSVILGK